MSTYREIIARVDDARPNGYSEQTKFRWLAMLEGKVAADVFLMDIAQIRELEPKWPESLDRETLVSFPHDDIYDTWLEAKILAADKEYSDYQNAIEYHNEHFNNFVKWFARVYRPAQGGQGAYVRRDDMPVYYLTAYAIAVKAGFDGTVEQWLESLKGEKGEPGKSAYQYAQEGGFQGSEEQFTEHMVANGKTAYAYAVEAGYEGTIAEFSAKLASEWAPKDHNHEGYVKEETLDGYSKTDHDHDDTYVTPAVMQEYAQPKGDYLTAAPVESVNGKTGKVQLGAEDVGAVPKAGGTVDGPLTLGGSLILTEGVNLFPTEADLPADGVENGLYFTLK